MISTTEIDELYAYISSANIWTQKVTDWFNQTGQDESQQVLTELTSNVPLTSEIIKCTLTQVNEDEWTVETWKEKLKKKGKSFDITLQVTLNYLTWLLRLRGLSVVGGWELLNRHKIFWTPSNSHMNKQYDGRTKFYFDFKAALLESKKLQNLGSSDKSVVQRSHISELLMQLKNVEKV